MPQVSIIIPNYNHSPYLPQRIESVLGQTVRDIEILVLDDCSSDNSREIIDAYAKKYPVIKTVYNERNSGSTFKQWNKGIALATGKYVWIAESDDVADTTFLQKLVNSLEANPAAGLAYCQSWRIDEHDQVHSTLANTMAEIDESRWQHDFVMPGIELVRRYMAFRNIIPNASAVLLRRSLLSEVGLADETMRLAGDWVFWMRCMILTDVAFIAEPLNYFRFHQRNVRSRTEYDGTLLLEVAKAMKLATELATPEPQLYRKAIDQMLERWLHGLVYYDMPLAKHRQFLSVMATFEPGLYRQAWQKFGKFLVRNRLSGVKMLVGDKLLGRARATRPTPL